MKVVVDCSGTLPEDERVTFHELTEQDLEQIAVDEATAVEATASMHRAKRNGLLAACDWTQIPDSPLTDAKRKAWCKYRQELRDLKFDGIEPDWPKPPKS